MLNQSSLTLILSQVVSGYLDGNKKVDETPVIESLRNTKHSLKHLVTAEFSFKGSGGQKTKADVPWIAVFLRSETTGASRGMYPVYLFSKDMQSIYLSLNQGTDGTKNSISVKRSRMKKNAEVIRQGFESNITDGFLSEIHLNSSLTRPKNYEAGNILAIRYEANSLPSEDTLVSDLHMMLWIYRNALKIPTPFPTGGKLRNMGLVSIDLLKANEVGDGFNPKPDSPVMVQRIESTMIRYRLHETLVRDFGEHAISLGFHATTPHPHDIELITNGSTWIVEAKIIYNNGIKDAVRAAIGQLFCYRYDAAEKQAIALFNMPIGERGIDLLLSLGISTIYRESNHWRVFAAKESLELLRLDDINN